MMKAVIFALAVGCVLAIPGGWFDVDVNDQNVVKVAREATRSLGEQLDSTYHVKLQTLHKARQQVVAGMNYKFTLTVGVTECKRTEVNYENVESCEFQKGDNVYHRCEVNVFRSLKNEYSSFSSSCVQY